MIVNFQIWPPQNQSFVGPCVPEWLDVLGDVWIPRIVAVAPYSRIMKRSSGEVEWPPEGVACATAVLHKLTQEVSRPILVPSLRHTTSTSNSRINLNITFRDKWQGVDNITRTPISGRHLLKIRKRSILKHDMGLFSVAWLSWRLVIPPGSPQQSIPFSSSGEEQPGLLGLYKGRNWRILVLCEELCNNIRCKTCNILACNRVFD